MEIRFAESSETLQWKYQRQLTYRAVNLMDNYTSKYIQLPIILVAHEILRKSKVNSEATTWGVLSEKVFFKILEISQSLF